MNAVVVRGYLWSFSLESVAFRAILSVVFVTQVEAVIENAVGFAQVQACCKGLNCFSNCGGVPLVQKSL